MSLQIYTIEDSVNVILNISPLQTVDKALYYAASADAAEYPTISSAQADCNLVGSNYIVVGPHPHPHH